MSASPPSPAPVRPARQPVQYKGDDLDAERGPGLGCFRLQLVLLLVLLVATPISVVQNAPFELTVVLFTGTMALLLLSGQTIIFLLRLVAAERAEGRRRPLASATKTMGELEDDATPGAATGAPASSHDPAEAGGMSDGARSGSGDVRQ